MKALSECRVLIVDDTRTNLDLLSNGLRGEHQISVALNGEAALEAAARTPPDLVLLDIMMPGLDGYEVCRRLRAQSETAEIPIIFLSSLDEVQNKARGFEAGANDYVTKPFELLEVKARVRSLLKAKAYSDAVKEQMASELRVARDIQMGMIPQDFGRWLKDYGVEVAGSLEPAREVGGDLYCVFPAGPDRLFLAMGDVSGKGIPAALFMVRVTSFLQLLARDVAEPERILERLNNELAADNPSGMFVTLAVAVFERRTRRLSLANGGQTRPILLRANEPARWVVDQLGTALGLEPDLTFHRSELELCPGDNLLLYTDGVNEAFNSEGECYGNERLIAELSPWSDQPAKSLVSQLCNRVRTFAAGAPQSDDITVLALHLPKALRNGD
jgi:sigma-B regulation protein RsbU (phosphoserine phosphatase)